MYLTVARIYQQYFSINNKNLMPTKNFEHHLKTPSRKILHVPEKESLGKIRCKCSLSVSVSKSQALKKFWRLWLSVMKTKAFQDGL